MACLIGGKMKTIIPSYWVVDTKMKTLMPTNEATK